MKKMNPLIPKAAPKVVTGKPSSVTKSPVRPGSLLMKVSKRPKLTPKEPSGPPPGQSGSSSSRGFGELEYCSGQTGQELRSSNKSLVFTIELDMPMACQCLRVRKWGL